MQIAPLFPAFIPRFVLFFALSGKVRQAGPVPAPALGDKSLKAAALRAAAPIMTHNDKKMTEK